MESNLSSAVLTNVGGSHLFNCNMSEIPSPIAVEFEEISLPIIASKKQVNVKLSNRSFSISIEQITLSIATAATVYKL